MSLHAKLLHLVTVTSEIDFRKLIYHFSFSGCCLALWLRSVSRYWFEGHGWDFGFYFSSGQNINGWVAFVMRVWLRITFFEWFLFVYPIYLSATSFLTIYKYWRSFSQLRNTRSSLRNKLRDHSAITQPTSSKSVFDRLNEPFLYRPNFGPLDVLQENSFRFVSFTQKSLLYIKIRLSAGVSCKTSSGNQQRENALIGETSANVHQIYPGSKLFRHLPSSYHQKDFLSSKLHRYISPAVHGIEFRWIKYTLHSRILPWIHETSTPVQKIDVLLVGSRTFEALGKDLAL